MSAGPESRLATVSHSGRTLLWRFAAGSAPDAQTAARGSLNPISQVPLRNEPAPAAAPGPELPLRFAPDPGAAAFVAELSAAGIVSDVAFLPRPQSPDGRDALVSAVPDALEVRVGDTETDQALGTLNLKMAGNAVRHVAVPPGAASIVTADEGGGIRTWSTAGLPVAPDGGAVSLDPLEARGPASTNDAANAAGPESTPVFRAETRAEIRGLAAPSGERVFAAVPEGVLQIPNTGSGAGPELMRPQVEAEFFSVAVHAGTGLIAGGYHRRPTTIGGVAIWEDGDVLEMDEPGRGLVFSLAFSPAGDRLAAGFRDGSLVMYGTETPGGWEKIWEVAPTAGSDARRVAFTSDGGFLVTANEDGTVRFHDPSDEGRLLAVLEGSAGKSGLDFALALSPDGRRLATSSALGIAVWDLGQIRAEIEAARASGTREIAGDVVCAACIAAEYLPAGFVTVDGAGRVRLWDPETGLPRGDGFDLPVPPLGVAVLGPDQDRLALARPDGSVEIRDLNTGEELVPLIVGLHGAANVVAATEDGRHLLIGGLEGGARMVDLEWHTRHTRLDWGHALHIWASRTMLGASQVPPPLEARSP